MPSRSATPQGLNRYLPHSPAPPPLNRARCEALCAVAEQDLELMKLSELERMRDDLDQLSVDASEVLTHALLMREKEVGDGETYHGMIQVSEDCCCAIRRRLAADLVGLMRCTGPGQCGSQDEDGGWQGGAVEVSFGQLALERGPVRTSVQDGAGLPLAANKSCFERSSDLNLRERRLGPDRGNARARLGEREPDLPKPKASPGLV